MAKKSTRPDESVVDRGDGADTEHQDDDLELRPVRPCPICYPRFKGIGIRYSHVGDTAYVKCDHCGHTWAAPATPDDARLISAVFRKKTA